MESDLGPFVFSEWYSCGILKQGELFISVLTNVLSNTYNKLQNIYNNTIPVELFIYPERRNCALNLMLNF